MYFNSYPIPGWGDEQVDVDVKKYIVATINGTYLTSHNKESAAIKDVKSRIKLLPTSRYLILEAIKEIGAKTPEIEIEEI